MRKLIFLLVIIIFSSVAAERHEYVPGEVIIYFKISTEEIFYTDETGMNCIYPNLMAYLNNKNVVSINEAYHGPKGVKNIYLLKFDENADILSIMNDLKSYPEVKSVAPNTFCRFLIEPNDWYYNNDWWMPDECLDQWQLQLMQANKAWDIEKGDSSITIAILDTGVDYFHQDLKANIWVNPGEDLDGDGEVWDMDDIDDEDTDDNGKVDDLIGWDFVGPEDNNPYPGYDPEGKYVHGTMMSSVCAITDNDNSLQDTSIAGITWNCKIVPIRVDDRYDLINSLNYVASMEFDVVNMSLFVDTNPREDLHDVIKNADSMGVVLVAAITQDSPWIRGYPAAFEEVIEVSAVDETGRKLSFRNEGGYADSLDICGLGADYGRAPRQMVVTAYEDTAHGHHYPHFPGSLSPHIFFRTYGWSSYASAQVSALAGLLRSMYPDATNKFIEKEIKRGAIPVDTAQGNIGQPWQYKLGAGRINPYRSLTQWGRLRNDTTWANFVYVSADLKVDPGVTLTIESGTDVYFAPDDNDNLGSDTTHIAFEVWGTLNANGVG